jgi:uncharacterized coiled-coil protein SlyX
MKHLAIWFFVLLLCSMPHSLRAQDQQATSTAGATNVRIEEKLESISAALAATRQQLEESQRQIQQLREELGQMRKQSIVSPMLPAQEPNEPNSPVQNGSNLQERVEALEEEVKTQDQAKVESSSKYRLRINGLVLINGFINRGTVDNLDLPSVALPPAPGTSVNTGAGLRQSIIGIQGFGPRIAGAKTSANVSFDFYGGLPYSNYVTAAGIVRMRTASVHMDWERNSLEGGMEAPLISPLSPTTYAMVAEPGMAWAGNLWTWAGQLRYAHQFVGANEHQHLQIEAGLWDDPATGVNSTDSFRVPSPSERSGQPSYEGRVSYGSTEGQGFEFGVGGYYGRQVYPTTTANGTSYNFNNNSWAVTTDWRVPFVHRFELSGEGYRGQSLGGLGGGVYKDVISGTNPNTGTSVIRGLNDIGGWTQLKSRFGNSLEANAAIGQDNGFAGDFHSIILPPNLSQMQLRARNRMLAANLIYRPKTYLIFSPEYRRIWTWPIYGVRNTADIFTLSVGYEF